MYMPGLQPVVPTVLDVPVTVESKTVLPVSLLVTVSCHSVDMSSLISEEELISPLSLMVNKHVPS